MDFANDAVTVGRRFRVLAVVDGLLRDDRQYRGRPYGAVCTDAGFRTSVLPLPTNSLSMENTSSASIIQMTSPKGMLVMRVRGDPNLNTYSGIETVSQFGRERSGRRNERHRNIDFDPQSICFPVFVYFPLHLTFHHQGEKL